MTQQGEEHKPGTIIYSGSFDPPGFHTLATIRALEQLDDGNDQPWLIPYGERPGKKGLSSPKHVRQMILRMFTNVPKRVVIDFMDLGRDELTPNVDMDRHFKKQQPDRPVWHVVGTNMITGGARGESKIQLKWKDGFRAFYNLHFIVLVTPGTNYDPADLPLHHKLLHVDVQGTSQEIRTRVSRGESIDHLVPECVRDYICENGLYLQDPAEK